MTKILADDVLSVLRVAPAGLTTAEVAEKLNIEPSHASTRLSALATYGRIDREWERGDRVPGRWCRWRMREGAHA